MGSNPFLFAKVENRNVSLNQLKSSLSRMIAILQGGFLVGRGGGRGQYCCGIRRSRGNHRSSSSYGHILSAAVDGKIVKSKSYLKAELRAMTDAQRNKVIELNKK